MSGFTGRRASGTPEQSGAEDLILTWGNSNAMLPLVGRIATDILGYQEKLTELYTERDRLDRNRQKLAWPERSRRYQVNEEIASVENALRAVLVELDGLGLTLLEPAEALIGFPTRVNDRKAFFSWKPGENQLTFWTYAGERTRRTIPEDWTREEKTEQPRRKSSR